MTTTTEPVYAVCGQCQQKKTCFFSLPAWGRVPGLLCVRDWGRFAEARASGSFVDYRDAFNNATDEQLEEGLKEGSNA